MKDENTKSGTQTTENSETTAPKRRGRRRSLKSEHAILDATAWLLSRKGYGGFSLDDVVSRARVSKSTIYRRWKTKEHLVIATFDTLPFLTTPDQGDVCSDLIHIAKQFIGPRPDTPLRTVLPALVGERAINAHLSEALDPMIKRRREPIITALRRGVDQRVIRDDVDLELVADTVMGPVVLRMFFGPTDPGDDELRTIMEAILRGYRPL